MSEAGPKGVTAGHAEAKMDSAAKAAAFRGVLGQMAAGQKIDPALWDEFVAAQNDALATGPKVGERVPDFTLTDQNGKVGQCAN